MQAEVRSTGSQCPSAFVLRLSYFPHTSYFEAPVIARDRPPSPTDYLFEWTSWLNGEEQGTFAREFDRVRAGGSAAELTQLMIDWHNRAMQRQARRRRLEREDEGGIT